MLGWVVRKKELGGEPGEAIAAELCESDVTSRVKMEG